jgi:hypothetical protein
VSRHSATILRCPTDERDCQAERFRHLVSLATPRLLLRGLGQSNYCWPLLEAAFGGGPIVLNLAF